MGLFGSPNNSSILGSIPPYKSGYAGGFISTIRNFCFSIGIALSASIFSYTLALNEPALGYAASLQQLIKSYTLLVQDLLLQDW